MADKDYKDLPSPQQLEADREKRTKAGIGFDDVLRYLSLGMAPTAPRLPEQASMTGQYFGGYPKGFTNRLGAKGTVSFHILRQVAERSPVLSAILSTRQHQRQRFARIVRRSKKNEVGLKVVHKRSSDPRFKVPEGFQILCREVEEMLEKPWRVFWDEGSVYKEIEPSFASFSSKITDDLLILNRPVIELGLDPLRVPRAFGAIDGANVIPTFSAMRYLTSLNRDVPKDWDSNYQAYRRTLQVISEKYKVNLDERTEYIYILNGKPVAGFRQDELIVAPMMPTTDVRTAGYPKSLVEKSIFIILSEIMAMTANSRYFEFGSMAESLIAMKGNYNDRHVKDLESIFQGNMSGVNGMFRVPMVALPGGADDLQVVQLKQNHKDMLFDIYIQKLTNLACAVFRMHPSEINEAPRAGDNSGGLNQASQSKQIEMAQEQGLEAMLLHEKTAIYDPMLQRIDPDLCVEWDYGKSESEALDLTTRYAGITTVNERRQMMDLDPISDEEGGKIIDNQYIQAYKQQAQQAEQAQQQAQQGGPQGPEQGQAQGGDEDEEQDDDQGGDDEPQETDEDVTGPAPGSRQQDEKAGKQNAGTSKQRARNRQKPPENESGEDRIKRLAALQG